MPNFSSPYRFQLVALRRIFRNHNFTMSRLEATFSRLKSQNHAAFIAYLCAGDPDLAGTRQAVAGLIDAGADIIELGIPFSDPLADGATNQAAADRALKAGTTTAKVLELVAQIRADFPETPLVLFTYLNPVYTWGYQAFLADAEKAGADGILLLDLPPDEAKQNSELHSKTKLDLIQLIAPSTPTARRKQIASQASGFLYYVARESVTGVQTSLAEDLEEQVTNLRQVAGEVPVCVGFGISTPEQAATVASLADGAVVGSAIVRQIAAQKDPSTLRQAIQEFVSPLVKATHNRSVVSQ